MEKNEGGQLVRALGLKESISMTIGTVVGVGLFTCGSSQIGYVGSGIIAVSYTHLKKAVERDCDRETDSLGKL